MKKKCIHHNKDGTQKYRLRNIRRLNRRGFGINEVIGIAAGIIIAAAVVIPGLKTFAEGIMTELATWWTNMSTNIFTG
jgi:hypothetical protein